MGVFVLCVRPYQMYNSYQIHFVVVVVVIRRKFIRIWFDEQARWKFIGSFYVLAIDGAKERGSGSGSGSESDTMNEWMCEQQFIMWCNRTTSSMTFFTLEYITAWNLVIYFYLTNRNVEIIAIYFPVKIFDKQKKNKVLCGPNIKCECRIAYIKIWLCGFLSHRQSASQSGFEEHEFL